MGLTSGRTCTPTPSCPEAPPCTPVSPTACRRRSPPWPPPPSRSRSSLPPRGSTPSGSEAPSWPPCPPSSRCGSPSRSTTSPAPPSCTGSASKLIPRTLFRTVFLPCDHRERSRILVPNCKLKFQIQFSKTGLGPSCNVYECIVSGCPFHRSTSLESLSPQSNNAHVHVCHQCSKRKAVAVLHNCVKILLLFDTKIIKKEIQK